MLNAVACVNKDVNLCVNVLFVHNTYVCIQSKRNALGYIDCSNVKLARQLRKKKIGCTNDFLAVL